VKLSDLIKQAEEMVEKYGDIKVVVFNHWNCFNAQNLAYVDYANAAAVTDEEYIND